LKVEAEKQRNHDSMSKTENQGKTGETSPLLLLFEENREKQSKNELV